MYNVSGIDLKDKCIIRFKLYDSSWVERTLIQYSKLNLTKNELHKNYGLIREFKNVFLIIYFLNNFMK